jgi:hypothetical protein
MNHEIRRADEPRAKFAFGRLVATPSALQQIPEEEILRALSRHLEGDWGTLESDDWKANQRALEGGGRLFSEYHSVQNVKFWIITEADRSVTTVLLPEDY